MTEPKLVLKMKKALIAEGAAVAKIHGGRFSVGISDLLVCFKKRFFAFEAKLPGKEKDLSELQRIFLQSVRDAGGQAWVVTTVGQVLEIVRTRPKQKKGVFVYGDSG